MKKRLLLPLPPLNRSDYVAIVGSVLLIGIVLIFLVRVPGWKRWDPNWGFGKGWDCAWVRDSEPVCIKRP